VNGTRTASEHRLYALSTRPLAAAGCSVLPRVGFASFVDAVAPPLAIGPVTPANRSSVASFVYESAGTEPPTLPMGAA
jgi:hypothetical protein